MIFDGNKYALWSNRMETYLLDLGVDAWLSIVNGYKYPNTTAIDLDKKKSCSDNNKVRNNILNAWSPTVQSKVICCNSTKEFWDKLKNIYEGDEKVKQVNLQLHRTKFENMKMKESEDIAAYLIRVDKVVKSITGLGEEVKESMII